ncbi:MAG: YceI family protein [Acidimicrobiia bacterium]
MTDPNLSSPRATTKPGFFRRRTTYLVGVPVLLVLVLVGGPFVYINFIEGDPPAKLQFSEKSTTTTKPGSATTAPATVDGIWKISSGSQAGYRVKEVLFGQSADAVGRTTAITGRFTINATTVPDATFTVDLTKVKSDQDNRNNQFQGRIMNTASFPEATFKLTQPIELTSLPENLVAVTVPATGELTMHGTTRPVTFDLKARRNGAKIELNGTIPITFADYGISNPSFGPASVGDTGEIEFLLTFAK